METRTLPVFIAPTQNNLPLTSTGLRPTVPLSLNTEFGIHPVESPNQNDLQPLTSTVIKALVPFSLNTVDDDIQPVKLNFYQEYNLDNNSNKTGESVIDNSFSNSNRNSSNSSF